MRILILGAGGTGGYFGGRLAQAGGDPVDPGGGQAQPVEDGLFGATGAGGLDVLRVRGEDGVGGGEQSVGRGVQSRVLLGGGEQRETTGGHAGATRGFVDGLTGVRAGVGRS